jgi:FKBP-type peptidyl-prolyl cis-trans isomerase (trigger factor)
MVEKELDLLVGRAADRWKERGLDLDTYLKMALKSMESFRADLEPEARRRLETGLVLGRLADAESMTLEPEEVDQEIERMCQAYGDKAADVRKSFSSDRARRSMASMVMERKTVGRLIAIAAGEADAPVQAEEAVVETAVEPSVEPSIEPSAEPAAEPDVETASEPGAEPSAETATEPAA